MSESLLNIEDLHVSFPEMSRTVQAVRGCSLSIDKGEVVGLVGESGSGKSITSLACLGLVPSPGEVQGSIIVGGEQVVGAGDRDLGDLRGGKAAMIFQNPMTALNPFFSVGRQLVDAIRCHKSLTKKQAMEAAIVSLKTVHMPDPDIAVTKYPHQMSGGQLQRVMIAMALSCSPKLLIADEPTTALDVTVQAQIILLLRELAATQGLTILFITHDLGVVASLCDRVAVMYAGQIVETGSVAHIFANPMHPYTSKLLKTVPDVGRGKEDLVFIPGQVPDMANPPTGCAFNARCDQATDECKEAIPVFSEQVSGQFAACFNPVGTSERQTVAGGVS